MSHFTVMVSGEDLETQFAPFSENKEACPKHVLEFNDVEDECRKKYETDTHKSFYDSSSSSWGQVVSQALFDQIRQPVGEAVQLLITKKDMDGGMHYWKLNNYYHVGRAQDTHKCPEEYVWVKVVEILETNHPDKEVCFEGVILVEIVDPPVDVSNHEGYETFEQFMEEYEGYSERDEVTNRYGYWHNPQAKWDWYEVGGRWAGFFHIKPEFQHLYENLKPNFSYGWKDDPAAMDKVCAEKRVDSAQKGHIDWEFMMNDAAERAGKEYDFAMTIIGHLPVNFAWEIILADNEKNGGEARDKYWAQPRCVAWKEFSSNKAGYEKLAEMGISSFDGSPDDYLCSREYFVEQKRRKSICPFALLHNGKWAEKGKMGWWAMVSNENDSWTDVFHNALASFPDDTQLTMVDCHI